MTSCGPITYSIKLQNGGSLPSFLKFTASSLSLSILSMTPGDAKTYAISIKGTTAKYNPATSSLSASFNINVGCTPTTLTPGTKSGTYSFTLGTTTPLVISNSAFSLFPACQGMSVQYSASLVSGDALPKYATFDSAKNQLTVTDDGSLAAGTIIFVVTGAITTPALTATSTFTINIQAGSGNADSSSKSKSLSQVSLAVYANQSLPTIYASKDFALLTAQQYSMVITDPTLTFVTFNETN